jgi:hypothetical protein
MRVVLGGEQGIEAHSACQHPLVSPSMQKVMGVVLCISFLAFHFVFPYLPSSILIDFR